jgi:hypothetical protein
MDQSLAIQALAASYGGSDSTEANFNRPAYVRGFSAAAPIELPPIPFDGLLLSGFVGAESGSQTLYFKFTVPATARASLRLIPQGRRVDQYLGVSLYSKTLNVIPLHPRPTADPLYTKDGVQSSLGGAPAEALAVGDYYAVITSSQWRKLPFLLSLTAREDLDVFASLGASFELSGELSQTLSASLGAGLAMVVRLGNVYFIGENIPIAYAKPGYWVTGYGVDDDVTVENPQIFDAGVSMSGMLSKLSPT